MKEVRRRKNLKTAIEDKSIARKYNLLKKNYDNGLALQQSGKPEAKWTSSDFEKMIRFKQLDRKDMPSIPKLVGDRKTRWETIRHYPEPLPPTRPEGYTSKEEELSDNSGELCRGPSKDESSENLSIQEEMVGGSETLSCVYPGSSDNEFSEHSSIQDNMFSGSETLSYVLLNIRLFGH
jgi:hypothetical protein